MTNFFFRLLQKYCSIVGIFLRAAQKIINLSIFVENVEKYTHFIEEFYCLIDENTHFYIPYTRTLAWYSFSPGSKFAHFKFAHPRVDIFAQFLIRASII